MGTIHENLVASGPNRIRVAKRISRTHWPRCARRIQPSANSLRPIQGAPPAMDTNTLNHWRQTIKDILKPLAAIPFPDVVTMRATTVFDDTTNVYLVVVEGWQDVQRLHGCLVHVEIKGDKIWIQQDGTEHGVAGDLLA